MDLDKIKEQKNILFGKYEVDFGISVSLGQIQCGIEKTTWDSARLKTELENKRENLLQKVEAIDTLLEIIK